MYCDSRGVYLPSTHEEDLANPEGLSDLPSRRVADYSGGYESRFPHHLIKAPGGDGHWDLPRHPSPPPRALYSDYLAAHPHVTGLLAVGPSGVQCEEYRHGRGPSHRLQSWSMAKSVTSLLLGICLDRGLIRSLDDLASDYCPELLGTLHGSIKLRHLFNMSSGVAVDHIPANVQIYTEGFTNADSSVQRVVCGWVDKASDHSQGQRFNYNELCPLTIGMVLRAVTKQSLSEFCETALWRPLGAEADATWQTDSEGKEFNCIGFGCCLRDWARLGLLVAHRGRANGRRVVSDAFFDEVFHWGADEQQAVFLADSSLREALAAGRREELRAIESFGVAYKGFFWHCKPDASQPRFVGHGGQTVVVDVPSQTVIVQTAVEGFGEDGRQLLSLLSLFEDVASHH